MKNDLIVIEEKGALEVFSKPDGLTEVIQKIREEVMSVVPDATTKKGQDEIRSLAYKVSKAKTHLDGLGKQLTDDWAKKKKAVDENRRKVREELDALKEEVRRPLTEIEEREKARLEDHQKHLEQLEKNIPVAGMNIEELKDLLDNSRDIFSGRDWEEFKAKAEGAFNSSVSAIESAIQREEQLEAERKELEELRRKQVEQEQKEREERAAREAEERAREEARQAAEAERIRVENERRALEEEAARKEREHHQAIENARLEAERKEREYREALERAEQERERAAEAERQRIAEQARIEQEEAEKRQRNINRQREVHRAILDSLVPLGISVEQGKELVKQIRKGFVPHVQINY